jgi:HAE1 family hydrophobic/amphiphilic exporter-1
MSGIGIVVLVGVVVNDTILKVDTTRRLQEEGLSLRAALLEAGRRRYRPIWMTNLTTILGLVPMFFGRGAALRAPMAAAIIGGMLFSTMLTLLVMPVLYQQVEGWKRRGVRPSAAAAEDQEPVPTTAPALEPSS